MAETRIFTDTRILLGSERAILLSPKESTYVHQIRVSGVGTAIGLFDIVTSSSKYV